MNPKPDEWILWGSELSPFALKLEALLRFRGLRYRWMPSQGSFSEALHYYLRRRRLVAGKLKLTWPVMDALDEFPLVPFLFGPAGENLYDSTAIAEWLDRRHTGDGGSVPLIPEVDPAIGFVVRLLDEAFDEMGLYLAHHGRWKVSARDNNAGARLAGEFRSLTGPFSALTGQIFPARQVSRLPYLFSVAPGGDPTFAALPARLRPPARAGFPPTHELLEEAFSGLLAAVEPMLSRRPWLLGERFTLADASLYGQLGMNRKDPAARAWIERAAPATQAWIERIAAGDFTGHRGDGVLSLDATLSPLLAWTCGTFVPLMQQNQQAWERHRAGGEKRFNEAAFVAGRSLYDGTLLGRPFRSVAKTFQVRVWRDLRARWDALGAGDKQRVEGLLPEALFPAS